MLEEKNYKLVLLVHLMLYDYLVLRQTSRYQHNIFLFFKGEGYDYAIT